MEITINIMLYGHMVLGVVGNETIGFHEPYPAYWSFQLEDIQNTILLDSWSRKGLSLVSLKQESGSPLLEYKYPPLNTVN